MPSFNGELIFQTCEMETGNAEHDRQYNGFFGINGTESLNGGFRRRISSVNGTHYGIDITELISRQDLFRSYEDGYAYTLIDTKGKVWLNVQLVTFQESGRLMQDSLGRYYQKYTAQFMHLTP